MPNKNRLLIFSFYNEYGMVGDYVISLLRQMQGVVDRIIFVVNGELQFYEQHKVEEFTNEIIIRENLGMDYGAYRHVLTEYLNEKELENLDEIILCNDTFYGFFCDFREMFTEMEKKDLDVWGINFLGRVVLEHIQSYFLVFGKKTIVSGFLQTYFENHGINENNYGKAIAFLETRLLLEIRRNDFSYDTYRNTECTDLYRSPDISIMRYGLPILKRKCFRPEFCSNVVIGKAIRYIRDNGLYNGDFETIKEGNSVDSDDLKIVKKARIKECELIEWAKIKPFYIYGAGVMANELYYTYFDNNSNFISFVVSNNDNQNAECIKNIPDNSRILIGVRAELQEEIKTMIPDTMDTLEIWEY